MDKEAQKMSFFSARIFSEIEHRLKAGERAAAPLQKSVEAKQK